MIVLLDSGPLGLITNANRKNEEAQGCARWLEDLLENSIPVYIPEICDYEVRREFTREKLPNALRRLDDLQRVKGIEYLPITTKIMLKASDLWAEARQKGKQTADDKALDGDVILAATAISSYLLEKTVIATGNIKHLTWFTDARRWHEITVEDCLTTDDAAKKSFPISIQIKTKIRSLKH